MGNLGGYQAMTRIVKALGGPKRAAVIVGGGLLLTGAGLYAGGQKVVKTVIYRIKPSVEPCPTKGQVFKVASDGEDGNGLTLRSGDEYRVLECDGDAILLEVIGRPDNPHFVSGAFLVTVSDFPAGDRPKIE
jgi:hypothetical protein